MRQRLAAFILLLAFALISTNCGGGGGTSGGTATGGTAVSTGGTTPAGTTGSVSSSPAPASSPSGTVITSTPTVLSGQATLRVLTPVPKSDQSTVLANKAAFEKLGHIVAPDGSAVYWPDQPAVNFIVTYGTQRVVTDASGMFKLTVSTATPITGTIQHPTDSTLLVPFKASQLTPSGTPGQVMVNITYMACGMTAGSQDICATPPPSARGARVTRASVEPDTFNPSSPQVPPTFTKVLGKGQQVIATYPSRDISCLNPIGGDTCPGAPPLTCCAGDGTTACEQFNGILTDRGPVFLSIYSWYFGSTCDLRVRQGLCINENRLSDAEHAVVSVLGTVVDNTPLLNALLDDGPQPPSGSFSTTKIHCYDNHGGRPCQEVLPGELAVVAKDNAVLAKAGASPPPNLDVTVTPGEVVKFVVHNNGNWGTTNVEATKSELKGTLAVPAQKRAGGTVGPQLIDDGKTIQHFDGEIKAARMRANLSRTDPNFYYTDVDVTYTAPNTIPASGGADVYTLTVDGSQLTITFKASPPASAPDVTGTWTGTLNGTAVLEGASRTCDGSSPYSGTITLTLQSAGTSCTDVGTLPCLLDSGTVQLKQSNPTPCGLDLTGNTAVISNLTTGRPDHIDANGSFSFSIIITRPSGGRTHPVQGFVIGQFVGNTYTGNFTWSDPAYAPTALSGEFKANATITLTR